MDGGGIGVGQSLCVVRVSELVGVGGCVGEMSVSSRTRGCEMKIYVAWR